MDIVALPLAPTVSCWLPVDPPVRFVTVLSTGPVFGTGGLLSEPAEASVNSCQLSGFKVIEVACADVAANDAATAAAISILLWLTIAIAPHPLLIATSRLELLFQ
jgi:hypothetical protein